jgi:hypothetical protein
MARHKPATSEEIELIKDHFEKRGYGRIPTDTAKVQVEILKMIREKNNGDAKTN